MIVSRTVATPKTTDAVLMVAADAATAEDGVVSPEMAHTTSAFKIAAVLSVISRPFAAENVVVATGAFTPALVQLAAGDDPVNKDNPVTEIKVTALVASLPLKLTVNVAAADTTLLVNAVEAA